MDEFFIFKDIVPKETIMRAIIPVKKRGATTPLVGGQLELTLLKWLQVFLFSLREKMSPSPWSLAP